MKYRFFTWQLWAGFLLSVIAFFSYPLFFVRFAVTRDFPWANLLLYCVAAIFLVIGLRRAFGIEGNRRKRILGSILTGVSTLVFVFFILVVFTFARQLPPSTKAPQVGHKAPDFTLTDSNGKSVTLSELLTTPIDGKAPGGVLIVFYRGYW